MLHLMELVSPTPKMKQKLWLMMPAHVAQVCMEESLLLQLSPVLIACPSIPVVFAFIHCDEKSYQQSHRQGWPIQEKDGWLSMSEDWVPSFHSYNTRVIQHNFSLCKGCSYVTLSESTGVCLGVDCHKVEFCDGWPLCFKSVTLIAPSTL